jgi:hypothetical protein
MPETGWDNLAPQAAIIEWRGEGTCMALVVQKQVRFVPVEIVLPQTSLSL